MKRIRFVTKVKYLRLNNAGEEKKSRNRGKRYRDKKREMPPASSPHKQSETSPSLDMLEGDINIGQGDMQELQAMLEQKKKELLASTQLATNLAKGNCT